LHFLPNSLFMSFFFTSFLLYTICYFLRIFFVVPFLPSILHNLYLSSFISILLYCVFNFCRPFCIYLFFLSFFPFLLQFFLSFWISFISAYFVISFFSLLLSLFPSFYLFIFYFVLSVAFFPPFHFSCPFVHSSSFTVLLSTLSLAFSYPKLISEYTLNMWELFLRECPSSLLLHHGSMRLLYNHSSSVTLSLRKFKEYSLLEVTLYNPVDHCIFFGWNFCLILPWSWR
jgi:hypothetical protein